MVIVAPAPMERAPAHVPLLEPDPEPFVVNEIALDAMNEVPDPIVNWLPAVRSISGAEMRRLSVDKEPDAATTIFVLADRVPPSREKSPSQFSAITSPTSDVSVPEHETVSTLYTGVSAAAAKRGISKVTVMSNGTRTENPLFFLVYFGRHANCRVQCLL
jgi:hypothetical protein